jgi:hypothetical protein
MTGTYTPLANITLGSSAGTISFGSIPSTYRDLVLILNAVLPSGSGGGTLTARVNGDSGGNYSSQLMAGSGSSVAAATNQQGTSTLTTTGRFTTMDQTNRFIMLMNFMDYAQTDKHKTILVRSNNAASGIEAIVNRWANTAAITSVSLTPNFSVQFGAGTTVSLYGVIA